MADTRKELKPVDVLAVMDEALAYGLGTKDRAERMQEARAAVAELIAAASEMMRQGAVTPPPKLVPDRPSADTLLRNLHSEVAAYIGDGHDFDFSNLATRIAAIIDAAAPPAEAPAERGAQFRRDIAEISERVDALIRERDELRAQLAAAPAGETKTCPMCLGRGGGVTVGDGYEDETCDTCDGTGKYPAAPAAPAEVHGLREGNWHHPDGGRIVGWVIEPEDMERMKADAFCLPREVAEALENLRSTPRVTGGREVSDSDLDRALAASNKNTAPPYPKWPENWKVIERSKLRDALAALADGVVLPDINVDIGREHAP